MEGPDSGPDRKSSSYVACVYFWLAPLNHKPGQSKNIADKVIGQVLLERSELEDVVAQKAALEKRISLSDDEEVCRQLTLDLDTFHNKEDQLRGHLKIAEKALGVTGKKQLAALKGNPFLRSRMNARALRSRIRMNIVGDKFMRSELEHAFRRQIMRMLF